MIDVNDIENIIAVLYRVTDPFVKMESVRSMHVERKPDESDPTGRRFSIEFGGGPTSPIDQIDIQSTLNNIIHHLANLKDNLKNQLRSNGLPPNEVETQISKDINLQLIADLCNQEKHGYPLTRTRRFRLDPVIVNIHHELAVPLSIGFSNVFGDSSVVVDADITDGTGFKPSSAKSAKIISTPIEPTWKPLRRLSSSRWIIPISGRFRSQTTLKNLTVLISAPAVFGRSGYVKTCRLSLCECRNGLNYRNCYNAVKVSGRSDWLAHSYSISRYSANNPIANEVK